MKHYLLFFFAMLCLVSHAEPDVIILNPSDPGNDRSHLNIQFEYPNLFFYSSTQEIIIDGSGTVGYYDVEIASATSFMTVITVQVDGDYDTIDISSLPQGDYIITIYTPTGNSFMGYFDTY